MVLLSIDWTNLHELLRSLYDEMMPLCEDMASVAKGVAGIGALFYVAYRVWQSLSRAEEIDVFPLFRPFVLGLCIMFFPTMVLGTINGILSPVCSATSSLVEQQTFDMKKYQEEKDELEREAMLRDPAKAFLVSDEEFDKKIDELGWSLGDMDTMINMYGQKAVYDMGEKVRQWFRELLELFFQAASLLIDTLRTFFLIVLSILGPISFALAVYDGFQSTLTTWLSRYICIYLWLPVGDLFGAILSRIQVLMLQQDIKQMQDPTFIPDASNSVYCIFMIIGIIGYFCVPTVSSWIIQAGGAGAYGQKANGAGKMAGNGAAAVGGAVGGSVAGRIKKNVLNVSLKKTERRHGVQIIKKHRDIIPAATAVRNGIPGSMRTGNGLRHLKGIRVCRSAAAENLCVGQRKVADAGTLAGRAAEPPRGSEGTYQTFPRTVFHPVTGQERH